MTSEELPGPESHLLSILVHSGGKVFVSLVHLLHPLLDVGGVCMALLHQSVRQLEQQLHLLPRLPGLLLEGVVLLEEGLGLLLAATHLGVGAQVDVALLLDPGEGLPGGPLEEDVLLVLVEPLLLAGPVLQDPVLLSEELLQDNCQQKMSY